VVAANDSLPGGVTGGVKCMTCAVCSRQARGLGWFNPGSGAATRVVFRPLGVLLTALSKRVFNAHEQNGGKDDRSK
jgi:hypothetical protein